MNDWVTQLVETLGYAGIAFLMFIENVFPPIPSELIMPLAGFQAELGELSLWGVILAGIIGSVLGQLPLYWLGRWAGTDRLEQWADRHGKWIGVSASDIRKSDQWFDRHGSKAVFFCRLIPGVRSLVSIPAGVSGMNLPPFLLLSTLGMGIWAAALAWIGAQLGEHYERVGNYVGPISTAVIVIIILTLVIRGIRQHRSGSSPTSD